MLFFVDIALLGSLAWVVWLYFDFYIPKSLKNVKILQKYPFVSLCAFWVVMLCAYAINVHLSTESNTILENIEYNPPLTHDLLYALASRLSA